MPHFDLERHVGISSDLLPRARQWGIYGPTQAFFAKTWGRAREERNSAARTAFSKTGGSWEVGGDKAMTNLASDTITLNTMIARFNVERFRKILSTEIEKTKRQTLLQLVAEEKAKLSALLVGRDLVFAGRDALVGSSITIGC